MTHDDYILAFRYLKKTQDRSFLIRKDNTGETTWEPQDGGENISQNQVDLLFKEATAYFGWIDVRVKRNSLLLACDYTQLPDSLSQNKTAWAEYRQALRDITNQPDPLNIVWPIAPTTGGA